jgi:hypothetical protein
MPVYQGEQYQCDKSNDISATVQTHQLDGGNKSCAMMVMTPMQREGEEVSTMRTTTLVQQGQ